MKKYIKILSVILVGSILSSCLKDDSLVLNPEKGSNVIEFVNTGEIAVHGSAIPLYIHSYPISTTPVTLPVSVSYSGPEATAPQDINVKIALGDVASINAYNDEQDTHFEMIPTDVYTLGSLDVTIPKGQKTASTTISINTSKIDLTKSLVLPLKIVSSSYGVVSGNFDVILLNIGAKNEYDGLYTYTTSANTSLVANKVGTATLQTVNATTVKLIPGLLITYSNEVLYTINPDTKQVKVTCVSLGVQEPQDTRSKWDPATKTMTVFWKQGNGGRTFEEKFVYKGPRP